MKLRLSSKQTFKNLALMVAGCCLLFTSCKTYQVINYDTDAGADFGLYRSYAWLPDKSSDDHASQYHNDIIHNNIKNYLAHHFAALGYTPDNESPDLLFEQVITAENKTKSGSYTDQHPIASKPNTNYQNSRYYNPNPNPYNYNNSNGYNYNYQNRNYNNNYGYTANPNYSNNRSYQQQQQYKTDSHSYTKKYVTSTITLNAIDRRRNKLVWTATVQADIYDDLSITTDIHPAVHTLIKTYPVKPSKRLKHHEK